MSSSTVEKIKERLSIVDVVSSYLKLEKAGANWKAVCPFHNEKTPSFFISPSRGSFYCFGCGQKGDIFTFVEQFEGTDFKGALESLAKRAGVEIEAYRGSGPKEKNEKDRLYALMEAATLFYEKEIHASSEALQYVISRGLTEETIKSFRIGYAKDAWRALSDEMKRQGFSEDELVKSGLAKHPDDKPTGEIYDRFRDRILFPIMDTAGRVIAFSGRILHPDEKSPMGKYINSPETPIFKKGSTLYGLDKAKFEIRKRDQAILVEGQMDLVLSHQAGFTNTVASSGTALGDSLLADNARGLLSGLGQVHGLSNNLVIAYDGDKAGLRAAGRAEKIGLSIGMNVKVAKLPAGMDPADVILQKGKEEWKKIISGAEHIVSLYLSVLLEHPLSDHTRMRAIRDRILPYISVMPSAIERAHFIREIHAKTGIPEEALEEDVSRLIDTDKQEILRDAKAAPGTEGPSRANRIEDRLFGLLLWQEESSSPAIDITRLKRRLAEILGPEKADEVHRLSQDRRAERIFEVELLYQDLSRIEKDTEELLDNLEEEILGARLQALMRNLSAAERAGNSEEVRTTLEESQKITSRLNTIKSSRHINS